MASLAAFAHSSCHLVPHRSSLMCVKLLVLEVWNLTAVVAAAVLSAVDRSFPVGRTQERHKVEGLVVYCPFRPFKDPVPQTPTQQYKEAHLILESLLKLGWSTGAPRSPCGTLSFQTVPAQPFCCPEQWSQCGVCSLLYGVVHMGHTDRPCFRGQYHQSGTNSTSLHPHISILIWRELMAEGKQKLRKSDKTNFVLPPLSWEAWESSGRTLLESTSVCRFSQHSWRIIAL